MTSALVLQWIETPRLLSGLQYVVCGLLFLRCLTQENKKIPEGNNNWCKLEGRRRGINTIADRVFFISHGQCTNTFCAFRSCFL